MVTIDTAILPPILPAEIFDRSAYFDCPSSLEFRASAGGHYSRE
jgi:hypothetical protein